MFFFFFFFSSRRRHTRSKRDWSSDVCSSDLGPPSVRLRRGDQAAALPLGAPPRGALRVRGTADRPPGPDPLPPFQGAGHLRRAAQAWRGNALRMGIGDRLLSRQARRAPISLLPRMAALVSV